MPVAWHVDAENLRIWDKTTVEQYPGHQTPQQTQALVAVRALAGSQRTEDRKHSSVRGLFSAWSRAGPKGNKTAGRFLKKTDFVELPRDLDLTIS